MHFLSWVNNLGMRASRGVIISVWWAQVNVTSYGSTRKAQFCLLRKKISEHKNYQAHKEAINTLEIAEKDVLKTRAVDWKTVCSLCAFTYCQTWIHKVNKLFQTTARVSRAAYCMAENNKPLTNFENLIDLQEGISIDTGVSSTVQLLPLIQ